MSTLHTRGHSPRLRLPVAAAAILAVALVAGCQSVPTGELEALRVRPNLPDIRDIDKLERDRREHAADLQAVTDNLTELRAAGAHSTSQVQAIEYREELLHGLTLRQTHLNDREQLILERIAGDPAQSRKVFEQLEARLAPISQRIRSTQQTLLDEEGRGQGASASAVRHRAASLALSQEITLYEGWQNRIAETGGGYSRTSARGFPVLDGAALARRPQTAPMASAAPSSSGMPSGNEDDEEEEEPEDE